MDKILKLSFDEAKGVECNHCMLSFYHAPSDINKCAAIGIRPLCPEEGCRKDCPLVDVPKA